MSKSLNIAQATPEQVLALAEACSPATFERNNEDTLNDSYLKVGKMDSYQFSVRIVSERTQLQEVVCGYILEVKAAAHPIIFEIYKLNVYGACSSSLRTHM
jgi:hypothetical protein